MLGQLGLQLNIELDQAEHCDRDRRALKARHPDMRERRVQAVLAIPVSKFRKHRDDREEDADEAVLEDAYPDNLRSCQHNDLFPSLPDRQLHGSVYAH